MEQNFNNLLLRTAFSCMACDGEIATEEVALIKNMAIDKAMYGDINIDEELNLLLTEINSKGKGFLKQYLVRVSEQNLTVEQECAILQIAVDTIQSDDKIEYSEVKFFKVLRSNLKNVTDEYILNNVHGIDDTYLAEDIKQSYLELFDAYFENIELKELTIMIMKRFLVTIVLIVSFMGVFAQYSVGTSKTGETDIFGNTTTTHYDSYGRVTGTSTTGKTDVFGNTTTTHRNEYGQTIGTSTTGKTDVFGNTTTTHSNQYGQTTGTSTTGKTDIFGNTTTTHSNRYGQTIGTSTTGKTDIFGNTTTTQKSNNTNTDIWTW